MAFAPQDRRRLADLLREHSVKTGRFELASGQTASVYVDVKKTSLTGEGADLIGRGLWELTRGADSGADGVGGLTMGADPLVTAIAIAAHHGGAACDGIIVRKEAKGHGTRQFLEVPNTLPDQARVVAVDDVITTASSTITAIGHLREAGFVIEHAVCVVDREAGGRDALARLGVELHSLYLLSELIEAR